MVLDSLITHNSATGRGANPARSGTPGGGSGGGIYTDGNQFSVTVAGTRMSRNVAHEGDPGIFFLGKGQPRVTVSILR